MENTMINRLSDSKFFSVLNAKYNFSDMFKKVNFNDYIIPDSLIMDRLGSFKGYRYPFVDGVIEAVRSKKILPVDFGTPSNPKNTIGSIHDKYHFPRSIFNIHGVGNNGAIITYADMSSKGKYLMTPQGAITYYDIPDLTLYHLFSAAYVQYKLVTDVSLQSNRTLISKVGESYGLIVSKIIDNMFPIITTSNTSHAKVFFVCMVFCLQNMFGIDKETAMNIALKSKFIANKNDVMNECIYYQTDFDIMENVDNNTTFPLDNFCKVIVNEYEFITEKAFDVGHFLPVFNKRLGTNAVFCLENTQAFINMLVLGKAYLGIYNDTMIKEFLKVAGFDIVKEIAAAIK